jgi:hypothetical protein
VPELYAVKVARTVLRGRKLPGCFMQKKDTTMNKYLTIIVLLIFSSCCKDGVEVNNYTLTDYEKESIPYLANEIVKFRHTNGFEFDLTVISRQTELRKTEIHHCGDNYSTYETLTVELISNIPELYINVNIVPKEINPHMTILVNKYYFDLDMTSEPDIDTLIANGDIFNNIYQMDSYTSDTLVITPKQVLYNKEVGIIQITMTDNEKITIKK